MEHITPNQIIEDIDAVLLLYPPVDTQAHIEADAWEEMDQAIKEGWLTRKEGEAAFYKWFRLERGLPPE